MIRKTISVVVGCFAWVGLPAVLLANSAPVVSNVTASQRTDGSKKVDIRYNLADADGDLCAVDVKVSNDGGATWTIPITALTGAVGESITPGTSKLIVWDCKVDLPGAFGTQYKVRVCADDGRAPGVLQVSPLEPLLASGEQGGPFSPPSISYTLTNTGGTTLSWTATKGQSWVSLSKAGGTLVDGGSTVLTVSINSNANTLAAGTHTDGVLITNTTNHNGDTTRVVALTVSPGGMVFIPAGEFLMGNSFSGEGSLGELPRHAVYVSAFYMDRYEVTNAQYAAALNWAKAQGNLITVIDGVVYKYNTGKSYPYCDTTTSTSYSRITWNDTTFGVTSGKENHPMVQVSWYSAVAYANWRSAMQGKPLCYDLSTWNCNFGAGYRLPTEAEWEKAARGGVAGRRFPWSDSDYIQHGRANYYSSSYYWYDNSPTRKDHPLWGVGSFPYTSPVGFFDGSLRYKADFNWPGTATSYQTANGANGYGLHDMAGNVFEWCNDWYSSTYYSSSPYNNPRGPETGTYRVLRGGCWDDYAYYCRVAYRISYHPDGRFNINGLRLAAPAALDSP